MATSKVIFPYVSGQTLVVRALPLTGNAYLFTSTSVSEAPTSSGLYEATFTELAALNGAYRIVITLGGTGVATYQARWTGSDGETVASTELIDVSQVATSASIAALNDFDPASDTVANVTLVGTTTTNTDMRGTDSAALASSLDDVSDNVDAVLVDTGSTIPAQITALNDFDPASDPVANVTLVATTTTNTDMRGTDGANTTAPDNSSITAIKNKTDQFVFTIANQVDSNALSGGGGGLDEAGVRSAVGLASANLDTQLNGIPTVSEFEARTLVASAYFDPAVDVVANVTLVATTTTNTDMVGTNGANTIAPDNTSITAIKAKTDQFVFTIANEVDANCVSGGGGGGGDATLANQTAILAKLQTNPIEITNPLVDSSTLVLINHDNYSSNNSRLITFPVDTDYSTATDVKLIFRSAGTNIKVTGGVVASATSITVDLEVDFGSSLAFDSCSGAVCDQVAICDFALIANYSSDEETIARGSAYIYDRAKEA